MNTSNKLTGGRGAKRILATVSYTEIKREVILAETDCVVTSCTGVDKNGNVVNFKTHPDYTWSEFKIGIPYTVQNGYFVTAVELASGDAVAY